jgi:UTP--glucose-1-phosphate uridylyltransferase
MKKITKAVIAAAGFGTRFLPQTKAMPKEMLPLVDKPIIQYVVEELVSVGIQDIVIVTGQNKRTIEDHFDRPREDLIANLKAGGAKKEPLLKLVEDIANLANFIYVRQKGPYGNGTPLLNVEHLIGDEPFIFTWSDDFFSATPTRFQQMIDVYEKYKCPVLSTIPVFNDTDYDKYGFVGGREISPGIVNVTKITEKPGKDNAPSNLANVSGYILTPDIFTYLHQAMEQLKPDQEFYSSDSLKKMLDDGKQIIACQIANGRYFDAGNKLDYIKANIEFALRNEEISKDLTQFLKNLIKN